METYAVPLIEGFVLNIGLIMGIGPQNTVILRQGINRQHLLLMVGLCTLIDALMIGLGSFGVGSFFQTELLHRPMTFVGIAALLFYGARSFKAALSSNTETRESDVLPSRRQVVLALLAVSVLNPSLLIDTMLLMGGSASQYQTDLRLWFVLGAVAASLIWFVVISYGSARLAPLLKRPEVLRAIDALSGGILWLMAFRLLHHLLA